MKPFSTVPKPLATVDLATGTEAVAIKQRTDVCAVPGRAASSARPPSRSSSPTPCWRSSVAILCRDPQEPRARTWRRCRDRVPGGDAGRGQVGGRQGAGRPPRGAVRGSGRRDRTRRRRGGASRRSSTQKGEAAFRALEAGALTKASTQDPSVVACGGGVVLEPANRITLRNTGTAVFLDVPLEQLRARVRPRPTARSSARRATWSACCADESRSTASSRPTSSTDAGRRGRSPRRSWRSFVGPRERADPGTPLRRRGRLRGPGERGRAPARPAGGRDGLRGRRSAAAGPCFTTRSRRASPRSDLAVLTDRSRGRGGQDASGLRRRSCTSWRRRRRTETTSWWRWEAGRPATSQGSSPPPTCAVCRSSRYPRR